MAGVRRRGHAAVLCPAHARCGLHQVEPAEDHRQWHGLALPKRDQTRAEGVNTNRGEASMTMTQTRRSFLNMTALAGAAGVLSPRRGWADEPALETTTVRFGKLPVICFAPQYVCEALLRAEGFTDIRYVDTTVQTQEEELGHGKLHFQSNLALDHAMAIDRGLPITIVAGVHAGCYELFVHGDIRGLTDLKGKRVGADDTRWLSLIAAYVGLDSKKDLNLVDDPAAKPLELFAEGKLDAYLGFPPNVQEAHARKVGHVILRTAMDPPWSQYFCCMLAANREYASRYPV